MEEWSDTLTNFRDGIGDVLAKLNGTINQLNDNTETTEKHQLILNCLGQNIQRIDKTIDVIKSSADMLEHEAFTIKVANKVISCPSIKANDNLFRCLQDVTNFIIEECSVNATKMLEENVDKLCTSKHFLTKIADQVIQSIQRGPNKPMPPPLRPPQVIPPPLNNKRTTQKNKNKVLLDKPGKSAQQPQSTQQNLLNQIPQNQQPHYQNPQVNNSQNQTSQYQNPQHFQHTQAQMQHLQHHLQQAEAALAAKSLGKRQAAVRRSASSSPIRAKATPMNPSHGIVTSVSNPLGVNSNFNQIVEPTGRQIVNISDVMAANPNMAHQDLVQLMTSITGTAERTQLPPAYANLTSHRVHSDPGNPGNLNPNLHNTSTVTANVQNTQNLVTSNIIDPNGVNQTLQNSPQKPRSSY